MVFSEGFKRVKKYIILIFLFFTSLYSYNISPKLLAKKLSLNPASKAIKQWERVFKSQRKMKRYGIDKLSQKERKALEIYLENHAADSDTPEFAGDI